MNDSTMVTANAASPLLRQAMQKLDQMSRRQKMAAAAAVALAPALIIGMWLSGRSPDYAVSISNLDGRDRGAILTSLRQQDIPDRPSPGGTAITMPSGMAHDVRLRMAAEGLSEDGPMGSEDIQTRRLVSSSVQRLAGNAREVEVADLRSIETILTPMVGSKRAATLDYELDRSTQHVRQVPVRIRRLSVVEVNHRTETLPNGQTHTIAPSDEGTTRITSLVREAIGFDQARGASLTVSNAPVAAVEETEPAGLPLWKDPRIVHLGKELVKYLVLIAALGFVYFGVIRPLIRAVATAPMKSAEPTPEEGDNDAIVSPVPARAASFEEKLARARELAKTEPKVVASIIKEWMSGREETRK